MFDFLAQAATTLPSSGPGGLSPGERLVLWRSTLFWGLFILMIFVVAALAIVRFSVRYRRYLSDRRTKPTPTEDVWKMHKLPDDFDE